MQSELLSVIRENKRNILLISRKDGRNAERDRRRNSLDLISNIEEVKSISSKLKTKAPICATELSVLRNRLADDEENVKAFLSVNGGLNGLIRELTGSCPERQVCACECLSNICVMSSDAASFIIKNAAAYLYTTLDSLNFELVVTTTRCLGNIASCGVTQCDQLKELGCVARLIGLLDSPHHILREATLYSLIHYVFTMKDKASEEFILVCLEKILKLKMSLIASQLLFYLSCNESCVQITMYNEKYIVNITQICANLHEKYVGEMNKEKLWEIKYLLRTLANLCCVENNSNLCLKYLNESSIFNYFHMVLQNQCPILFSTLNWFLSNIYKYSTNVEYRVFFFNKLVNS